MPLFYQGITNLLKSRSEEFVKIPRADHRRQVHKSTGAGQAAFIRRKGIFNIINHDGRQRFAGCLQLFLPPTHIKRNLRQASEVISDQIKRCVKHGAVIDWNLMFIRNGKKLVIEICHLIFFKKKGLGNGTYSFLEGYF